MSNDSSGTIGIMVIENADIRNTKGIVSREIPKRIVLSIEQLTEGLSPTVSALRQVFDTVNRSSSGWPITEVQVAFEVSASGQFSLMGSGLEAGGRGTLTLTFKGECECQSSAPC